MQLEPRELVLAIKAAGLTQQQIKDKTGISQSTISKIERGAHADVRARTYRSLVDLHQQVLAPTATVA
jgi:transcriptional regulator with XRE-family HTH domain